MALRRNAFDFPHTCPKIDKAIDRCKDRLEYSLISVIQSICSHIPDNKANQLAREFADDLYKEVESCFESVRETNEEMRSEADRQIEALNDEVSDLRDQIKDLERQLELVS